MVYTPCYANRILHVIRYCSSHLLFDSVESTGEQFAPAQPMQQRLTPTSIPSGLGARPDLVPDSRGRRPSCSAEGVANRCPTLEDAVEAFLRALEGKNRSPATLKAYTIDLDQFIGWVHENNFTAATVEQVEKVDITEYLAHLGRGGITGVSRARKLAAIREYFRYLEEHGLLVKSPATGVETPKREKNGRTYLTPEEYTRLLSLAGGRPRDYAIFQVFLQTGVRVSELVDLRLADVDVDARSLQGRGKGMVARSIELEKKGIQAIRSWLAVRPETLDDHLLLNYQGQPISERGVQKLVAKYRVLAGITKKASCHSLRHTFATYKAERGVSPFQLQDWLGHANLNTTQIYVHIGRQNARKVMEATSL